jgi:subtilisin family serine protease
VISGAAALLASAFPNLSGRQIVQLLLTTADDAGPVGRDSTFGNGILNIQRALSPQGQTAMAGSSLPADQFGGDGSDPMGDATPKMSGAIILDGYSRAYAVDFANLLNRAPQQRPLAQALQTNVSTGFAAAGKTMVSVTMRHNLQGQPEVGLAQTGMSYEDARAARAVAGYALSKVTPATAVALGFSETGRSLQQRLSDRDGTPFLIARDPLSRTGFHAEGAMSMAVRHDLGPVAVTLTGERGRVLRDGAPRDRTERAYSLSSVTADRRLGNFDLALGVSRLAEEQTVLGGRFGFAPGGSTSYFLDASAAYDLGAGWAAAASLRHGWTRMPGTSGLVSAGSLSTDAFALDLSRRNALTAGDRLGFRVAQPLRVRSGGYLLNLPVSYDYSTLSVGYDLRRFNLAPTGRELDVEAAYGLSLLGGAGYLSANAFWRLEPGHVQSAPSDKGAALRFSLGF